VGGFFVFGLLGGRHHWAKCSNRHSIWP
jgi:hypothetical protein